MGQGGSWAGASAARGFSLGMDSGSGDKKSGSEMGARHLGPGKTWSLMSE